ncbi:hypothetical protein ACIQCM_03530 [Pseudarthrobacter sp. NPDC092439]|uniref:hypothetical protein n=1 Tax=unclassified Pseudarthrobacter TaxID=2647000 RepID=UPI00381B3AC9
MPLLVISATVFSKAPGEPWSYGIIATLAVVIIIMSATSTVAALLRDGRGNTPPVASHEAWSALDLPSSGYSFRIF